MIIFAVKIFELYHQKIYTYQTQYGLETVLHANLC